MRLPTRIILSVVLLGWMVTPGPALSQPNPAGNSTSEPGGLRRARVYEVVSIRVFDNVNRDDVRASLKVLYEVMGRQKGFLLDSKVEVLESVAEIRERLRSHSVDLLLLPATDYLELESSRLIVPILTAIINPQGGTLNSYVLLVNPASAVSTIAGLRGKNILVSSRGGTNTALAWLEVLLHGLSGLTGPASDTAAEASWPIAVPGIRCRLAFQI